MQLRFQLHDLDLAQVNRDNLSFAMFVRLPFHLRTGPFFRIDDPENPLLQAWFRNKYSVSNNGSGEGDPDKMFPSAALDRMHKTPEDFRTEVLLVDDRPDIHQKQLDAVREDRKPNPSFTSIKHPAMQLLNELLLSHQMIALGPSLSAIGGKWPGMLSDREMISYSSHQLLLIAKTDHVWSEEDCLSVFSRIDRFPPFERSGMTGDLRDYTSEKMLELRSNVRRIRDHIFYELKENAISAMLRGDSVLALVLACAALEGVHGAFLRASLQDELTLASDSSNKLAELVLRQAGFHALVQLSIPLFLEESERPSDDDLKKCLRGVELRNSVMHALIKSKDGSYKIRKEKPAAIDQGYKGILTVYRAFEAAFESRLRSSGNQSG